MSEAILGAIVGAVIAGVFTYLPQYVSGRKAARYLAIRVSISLDEHVNKCASAMFAPDDHEVPPGEDPMNHFDMPDPLMLPDDVDWRSIDAQFAYDILSLVVETTEARDAVTYTWGVADGDAAFDEMCNRFSEIGLRANELSSKLKQICKLTKPHRYNDPFNDYDPLAKLKEKQAQRKEERKKRGSTVYVDSCPPDAKKNTVGA